LSGNEGSITGYIDVSGDIVTTGSWATGYVKSGDSFIKADNISTDAYSDGSVHATSYIDAKGDIVTRGGTLADVVATNNYLKAKSVSTKGDGNSSVFVSVNGNIEVKESITTSCTGSGNAYVLSSGGDVIAGSMQTSSGSGDAYLSSAGTVDVRGSIKTKSDSGAGYVSTTGSKLKAGSILTYAPGGTGYLSSSGDIEVFDTIKTIGGGASYVTATDSITARSIATSGSSGYVNSTNGSITVIEDITTLSASTSAYVRALSGSINAQKIRTQAPTGQDDSIQAASGSANFELDLVTSNAALIIKDAEFSLDHDYNWNTQLTLQGTCTINGNGNLLSLESSGEIIVDASATLFLKNIKISGISSQKVKCTDNTGTIKVDDVVWVQTGNTTFANGKIQVVGGFLINGPNTQFSYQSTQVSSISQNAEFTIGRGVTFSYNTGNNSRLTMSNNTSRLHFDGSTLYAAQNIRLATGTLVFDNDVTFNSPTGKTITLIAASLEYDHHVGSKLNVIGSFATT
jgi:hypothetical protein